MRLTRSLFNVFGYATVNLWSRTCVLHLRGTLKLLKRLSIAFFAAMISILILYLYHMHLWLHVQ